MASQSYPCVACPTQIFQSRAKLSKHYSMIHKNVKIPCPECKVDLSTIAIFRAHLKIHEPNRTRGFKCTVEQCGQNFYSAIHLSKHAARVHSTDKPFPCPFQCGKFFKTNYEVKSHIMSHTKEKPHKCDQCDSCFSLNPNLQKHIKFKHMFSDEKRHGCTECGMKYKFIQTLQRHIRRIHTIHANDFVGYDSATHIIERKLVHCYFCLKISTTLLHLEEHLRIHTTETPFRCPEKSCNYSTLQASTLRQHVQNNHEQSTRSRKHTCYFCLSTFSGNGGIVNHTRIHTLEEPFSCQLCRQLFRTSSDINAHVRRIHTKEKPHKCNQCEKCFSSTGQLKRHFATHTGKKRFVGDVCSYSSYNSGHLKQHYKRKHKVDNNV